MDIALILKALANEKRMQILEWLTEPAQHFISAHRDVLEEGVCVGLIKKKIGLSQSTVSQYLWQLQQAGLIKMERRGQWTYCKLNRPFIQDFLTQLSRRFIS